MFCKKQESNGGTKRPLNPPPANGPVAAAPAGALAEELANGRSVAKAGPFSVDALGHGRGKRSTSRRYRLTEKSRDQREPPP